MGFFNDFNKIYNYSSRELKRIYPIVDKVEALDESIERLTDDELRLKTDEFKERYKNGETLDDLLPEAFAVVREASSRVLGMKHYRVQLIGGVVLHQGRVAEMKTGEGKTLVATCPAYLNALTGKGVHIVTTNEYLAQRDCDEMSQVYSFLGITSGTILHEMSPEERREIYNRDIVYGINSEIGFDYLKDNMVTDRQERIQRGLNFAIVDEIDSILIDEARTPLIISGEGDEATDIYITVDNFVKSLTKDEDYEVDEKQKAVTLTNQGVDKLEKHFNIDNYADEDNIKLRHNIVQALKANYTMTRDVDYIENDEGEILIVDTFTGRVMDGRRFSDGLHQAIEAKEDVDIQADAQTLATITLQNLFRLYNKLSGMSGTVVTEESEFMEIYSLDVIEIPTNRPIARIDKEDKVYTNIKSKYNAVISDIIETHMKGQPILVGTASIQKSEDISAILKRKGIPHNVLNAKNHEKEAKIVERAGEKGAITIATNMAGRGTDIKLTEEVKALGGLKIIGTERHDSRRVDNQLRGRSGRQGDPGESIFYVSLEDDMIKNYISQKYKNILAKLTEDNDYIDSKSANKAVENAQMAVEGDNFKARKDIVSYDDVLNTQREVIYSQRNLVLDKDNIKEEIEEIILDVINKNNNIELASKYKIEEFKHKLIELNLVMEEDIAELSTYPKEDINYLILEKIKLRISEYEKNVSEEEARIRERNILLKHVDRLWIEYLKEIEVVRQGVNLRSYKQVDPVQIFMMESSKLFNNIVDEIKEETAKEILSFE
ncbi:preprotein translocase subunit SecA [Clostridium tertium]|uniref:preprotein translocase subunit SecA n=1 Tax=Clostridium tertium TaxID=1559 RepID=UPI0024B3C493|nr:preprotein translocase subunit SecA [Clostridium tertium]MDI9216990.1 preprotein translocase subunit SecA [Clostridium tertium]